MAWTMHPEEEELWTKQEEYLYASFSHFNILKIPSLVTNSFFSLKIYKLLQINRLGMDIQIDYFNITRKQFDGLLGKEKAREYIMKKSIFSITIGANDFLNNYLLPVVSVGQRILETPDMFVDNLIRNLRMQLSVYQL